MLYITCCEVHPTGNLFVASFFLFLLFLESSDPKFKPNNSSSGSRHTANRIPRNRFNFNFNLTLKLELQNRSWAQSNYSKMIKKPILHTDSSLLLPLLSTQMLLNVDDCLFFFHTVEKRLISTQDHTVKALTQYCKVGKSDLF